MNSVSYYRNLREYLSKYSNWNFYAGTKTFATDTFLEFLSPPLNAKYKHDSRADYSLKTLIGVSLISYITRELIYDLPNFGIVFVFCVLMQAAAFYALHAKKNYMVSRLMMAGPLLCFHLKYFGESYSAPALFALFPVIIYDVLAVSTWKVHSLLLGLHLLLLNLINYVFGLPQEGPMELKSVLLMADRYSFTTLSVAFLLDIVIFAALEKLLKENWVLKVSFDKSFRIAMSIIDANPFKMLICDVKGNILFANVAFINATVPSVDKLKVGKLTSYVETKQREDLYKALSATCTNHEESNLTVS